MMDERGGRAGVCSAGSAPSDPLDPVLERCCKSIAVFFQLPFCGSSGGLCGCGAGLGGFGGAISDVVLSGLGNSSASSDIGTSLVCFLDGTGRPEIVPDFMGSGGGLFVGLFFFSGFFRQCIGRTFLRDDLSEIDQVNSAIQTYISKISPGSGYSHMRNERDIK